MRTVRIVMSLPNVVYLQWIAAIVALCVTLCFCVCALPPPPPFPNAGQTVYLKAKNTGQTAPFTVTFGDGQLTRDVNKFLPTTSGYSFYVTFLRLEKTTGSFALYNRIIQSGFSVDPFNGDYPHLTTSYSGRYHWRVMNRNSTDTYQLNIVGKYGILSFFLLNDAKL